MDIAAAQESLRSVPRDFVNKAGQPFRLQLLAPDLHQQFAETYLAFQPRNSFQGLPPLKDEVCLRWVRQMIETGINILARSRDGRITGHTALFPIDPRKCEMLVVVWPQFQNQGIGTELTGSSIEAARELGFQRIWLPVEATNLRARHVYAKCGFRYVSSQSSRELDMVFELAPRCVPVRLPATATPCFPTTCALN